MNTPDTADALAAIDATVDEQCACGCGTPLPIDGPSGWFLDAHHQSRYQQQHSTNPHDVYRREDAAEVLVDADSVPIPLTEPGTNIDVDRMRAHAQLEDARTLALWTAGPAITWDRTDADQGEALTNDPRPPFEVSDELRPPATRALLTQRRYCHHCRSATEPVLMARPVANQAAFADFSLSDGSALEHIRFHGCRTCRKPLPAPAMYGTASQDNQGVALVLRHYTNGGRSFLTHVTISDCDLADNVNAAAAVEYHWLDMERIILEQLRPICVQPGCEEKAREVFRVMQRHPLLPPVHLCGRDWSAGDRIDLCPAHGAELIRGADPSNPGVMVDELAPDIRIPPDTRTMLTSYGAQQRIGAGLSSLRDILRSMTSGGF